MNLFEASKNSLAYLSDTVSKLKVAWGMVICNAQPRRGWSENYAR